MGKNRRAPIPKPPLPARTFCQPPARSKPPRCFSVWMVEHPFGTIKRAMNAGYFLCKGLESVRAEMSLTVLAYNLKRVLNLVTFGDLMKAVAVQS